MLQHILGELPTPLHRVAVVGDSRADIGLGRAADVLTIGVTWGAQARDVLEAEGADVVVDTVGELFERLARDPHGPGTSTSICAGSAAK
jgi:phosphoglycolate phosphatase-like HAD superfamily hydrolase